MNTCAGYELYHRKPTSAYESRHVDYQVPRPGTYMMLR